MTKLPLAVLCLTAACVPPGSAPVSFTTPAPDQGQTQAPAPDTRTPAQVVVDILAANGYQCGPSGDDLACTTPNDTWQFFVWYENQADGTVQVVYDSFINRAFAKRCYTFQAALEDLRDDSTGFSATCEDNLQKFRLRQRLVYNETLDVPAWAADHLQRRRNAGIQLRDIHALAKEDARYFAGR
jgi:hypothetical protein